METQSEAAVGQLPLLTQWARFGVVGACTAGLDVGFLYTLVDIAHRNYFYSAMVAFTAASTLNYLLSAQYVFRAGRLGKGPEFAVFMATTGAGLGLNQLIMWLLVGIAGIKY